MKGRDAGWHEHTQAHRTRQQAGRSRFVRRSAVVRAATFATGIDFVLGFGVASVLNRCGLRHEVAGEIPAVRILRQKFASEKVARPGADQIELQGFDEFGANLR